MAMENKAYLMEDQEEGLRLEIKTDPEALRKQAAWCGVVPGLRVLDVGCGPGKTSTILYDLVQPGGEVVGIDFSEQRISRARERYGSRSGLSFDVHDFTKPIEYKGHFDLIWVRFVLEYHLLQSRNIVRILTEGLRPGGLLCLIDLDCNCLNHYELPSGLEKILFKLMDKLQAEFDFDPYAGRKLYSHLYDLGYQDIQVDLTAHHLFYGEIGAQDVFNWIKKVEITTRKAGELFEDYPGGGEAFFQDFRTFFLDPRRFTYSPLILCKGRKPSRPGAGGET